MGERKTIKGLLDIVAMKETPNDIFGTEYKYMVETLYDWYIAKLNGEERIKAFLAGWNDAAQDYWIQRLAERIQEGEEDYEN